MAISSVGNNIAWSGVNTESGVSPISTSNRSSSVTVVGMDQYVGKEVNGNDDHGLALLPQPKIPNSEQIKGALDAFDKGPNGFVKNKSGLDAIMQMELALLEMLNVARESATTSRLKNLLEQVSTTLKEAGQMREAGQERFKAGLAVGISQIASGAVGVLSAGMQYSMATTPGNSEVAAQAVGGLGSGASGAITGTGTIVSASFEKEAVEHDARGKELSALAQKKQADAAGIEESISQSRDAVRQILELLRSMSDSEIATRNKIIG